MIFGFLPYDDENDENEIARYLNSFIFY